MNQINYFHEDMNFTDLSQIDLNLLVVLTKIYEEKSLSKAGEKLGRTQSAISHSLERMRTLLEEPLFFRTSDGMQPTEKCTELYERLIPSLLEIERSIHAQQQRNPKEWNFRFHLCMSDYCSTILLPPLMKILEKQAPNLEILVSNPTGKDPAEMLKKNEIDFFIGHRELGERFCEESLFQEQFACLVSDKLPLQTETIQVEDFCRFSHVLFTPAESKQDRIINDFLAEKQITRKIVLRVPSVLVIPYVISANPYIVTIPLKLAEFVRIENLRILKPPFEFPKLKVSLFWSNYNDKNFVHCWLRKQIKAIAPAPY